MVEQTLLNRSTRIEMMMWGHDIVQAVDDGELPVPDNKKVHARTIGFELEACGKALDDLRFHADMLKSILLEAYGPDVPSEWYDVLGDEIGEILRNATAFSILKDSDEDMIKSFSDLSSY